METSLQTIEESSAQKNLRSSRSLSGSRNIKLLSKVASSVKFVLRASNDVEATSDSKNRKSLFRKGSNVMRVAYIGPNGQLNNRALLVPKERLDESINFENNEDRKLIINVLVKRPHRRYDNEVLFLQKAFRDINYFQNIEKDLDDLSFKKIFAALQLEVCEPGQKLFNYGDIGKKFYIIIEGSVYILVPNEETLANERNDKQTPKKKNQLKDKQQILELERKLDELPEYLRESVKEDIKKDKVQECYPGFHIACSLSQGEGFGELAFQKNGDKKRSATVVCRQKTLLGVLSYEDFQRILNSLYERKYHDKIAFFLKVDLFQHWRSSELACLILHMEENKFVRNQMIFKEGDPSTHLYFITKGEIELQKKVEIPKPQDSEEEVIRPTTEKALGRRRIKINRKPEAMRLAIITEGDYFGDTEFLSGTERECTAIVSSTEATLISISKANFMTFVKDAQTLEMLKDHIKRKTKWREELTSNFVNVYAKAEEKSHKLQASKIMQNLSGFNIISPKSKHEKENIKPFPFSQNITYNPESQLFTKINPTDLTKGIPKLHRPHGSISFTKLEKSLTSLERELSAEKQRVPKALRYLSLKKMGKKIDDTYQKQIRRINRRLQADRDKVKDEENFKEEGLKDNEKPKEKPQINENIGKMKLSQTLSMILKTKVSPKSMKGISLNNIDCSENDPMFFRGTSMNAIENFHKNPSSITSIMDLDKQLPPPIKQTPLKSSEKKVPQSLNDLEINCTSGEKGCAPFDKTSSTVRIHNRLKKILQFEPKQQAQQDHPRFLSIKSQLLDSKSYVMLNSLELNVSPKRSLLQSFNVKTRKGSFFQKKD